jgi:hypothetical protein
MGKHVSTAFALAAILTLASAVACGGGTAGEIVILELGLESLTDEGDAASTFTTDTGYEVALEEARLAIGPAYFYAPIQEPRVATLRELLRPVARAHGGHDPVNGRRVRAELLDQQALDLLVPGVQALGAVDAEAGAVDEVAVVLDPPRSDLARSMNGHHAWVRGTATKDGEMIRFAGGLDLPDEGLTRRVEGIAAELTLAEGGVLVLGVRLHRWFHGAHFDRLEVDDDGVAQITAESQVRGAWLLGVRSAQSYEARFEAP